MSFRLSIRLQRVSALDPVIDPVEGSAHFIIFSYQRWTKAYKTCFCALSSAGKPRDGRFRRVRRSGLTHYRRHSDAEYQN